VRARANEEDATAMEVFKYDEVPWTDPDRDAGVPSRGVKTKKLAQGVCGFFVQSSVLPPGLRIEPHSHTVDELFFVLEGGCALDDGQRLSASDTAIFPANEVYGFTVGDDGMRYAVIRNAQSMLRYA
jgi:cupin domain